MITNQDNIPPEVLNIARRIMQLAQPKKAQTFTVINSGTALILLVGDCLPTEILHIDKGKNE